MKLTNVTRATIHHIEEVVPYCDPKKVTEAKDFLDSFRYFPEKIPEKITQEFSEAWAGLHIGYMSGQRLFVLLLKELKQHIEAALERMTKKSPDIAKVLAAVPLKNEEIAQLYRKLARELGPGKTKIAIALDFTNGDTTRANSLLRQVRRYSQELKEAENAHFEERP